MNKLCIGVIFLCLAGCETTPTAPLVPITTQVVKVPVAVCPIDPRRINKPIEPDLLIDSLTKDDVADHKRVGTAYMSSIAALEVERDQWRAIAEEVLAACEGLNTDTIHQSPTE